MTPAGQATRGGSAVVMRRPPAPAERTERALATARSAGCGSGAVPRSAGRPRRARPVPVEITAILAEWYTVSSSHDSILASFSTGPAPCSICSSR